MHYQIIPPAPHLAHIVRSFWTLSGQANVSIPMSYRLFADACPNLIFSYGNTFRKIDQGKLGSSFSKSLLHGQTNQFEDMAVTGQFGIIGVYLYPSSLSILFNLPGTEITNEVVDVQTLLGQEGSDLEDRILHSLSTKERIGHISEFITSKLTKSEYYDKSMGYCVNKIIGTDGNTQIEPLAYTVNLSRRQLERKFLKQSGLSPKLFSRITRFRKVIKLSNAGSVSNLSSLAYEAGYSDQSHFIREFKEFSGYTPKVYFKQTLDSADTFVELS